MTERAVYGLILLAAIVAVAMIWNHIALMNALLRR